MGSCDVGTCKHCDDTDDEEEPIDTEITRRKREEQRNDDFPLEKYDRDEDGEYDVKFNCKDICVKGSMECNKHKGNFIRI